MRRFRSMTPLLATLALVGASLLLGGCQGAGDPASTATGGAPPVDQAPTLPLASVAPGAGMNMGMGLWTVSVTPDEVALSPVRTGSFIGESWTLDVTEFFQASPCVDCLRLAGFGFDGTNLELELEMVHPFPDIAIRTDLDVFDPRVILYSNLSPALGAQTFDDTPGYQRIVGGPLVQLAANLDFLQNPDGYTTHFDARVDQLLGTTYSASLHPYKDYAEFLQPGPIPNPEHRLRQTNPPEVQSLFLTLPPSGNLDFALVLEANYGQSATKPTRLSPEYYVPEFNRKEAFHIEEVFPGPNTIANAFGASVPIEIEVADWQQTATVDPGFPNPANRVGLRFSSDVAEVIVEAPTVMAGTRNSLIAFAGTGLESDPLRFNVTIDRDRPLPPGAGPQPVLVTVVDELDGQPISIDPLIDDLGFTNDVRAYYVFDLDVVASETFAPLAPGYTLFQTGLQRGVENYPGGPIGGADVAVYNDGTDEGGIYMSDADYDLVRFGQFWGKEDGGLTVNQEVATGYTPFDDFGGTNPHPNPFAPMVIEHLDASDDGSAVLSFADSTFTFDPARLVGVTLTRELPNDTQAAFFDNSTGTLEASPRFLTACGSAGAVGTPAYGERQINVCEAPNTYTGFTQPLGWLSGGPGTELCGDTLDWFLYGSPFSSSSRRIFNGKIDHLLALDGITPADWDNLAAWDVGTLIPNGATSKQLAYTLTTTGRLTIFNLLNNITETRETTPVFENSFNIASIPGLWEIRDMQLLEFDPANPRIANGWTQVGDWFAVLYNSTDVLAIGGKLRIYEYDHTTGTLNLIQELADGAGATPHPSMMGMEVEALDVDDANYFVHITMDEDGRAVPGGNLVVSVIGLL